MDEVKLEAIVQNFISIIPLFKRNFYMIIVNLIKVI